MREKIQSAGAIHLAAALGRLLVRDGLLLAHSRDDGDEEILAFLKAGLDFLANVTLGDLDVVLGDTVVGHQVEETVVDVDLEYK